MTDTLPTDTADRLRRSCRIFWKAYATEERRRKPETELSQCGKDMYGLCIHCVGRAMCPAIAEDYIRCYNSIKSIGEYQRLRDCDRFLTPLEQCAGDQTRHLYENAKK